MPIHLLTDIVAAQIAAGEVVERPASVAKELIENALDAGATAIQIDSSGGGRQLLRVSDNGHGIPSAEVELAFARHATSKLNTVDDLDHIQTLGFRGEALASIASVAHVTLRTRVAEESTGTLIRLQGGEIAERRAIGTPPGTSLTVESLFYNVPARLKFLKSDTTERRHVDTLVMRYATAYPNVRFTLTQDNRAVFQTTGNGSLLDVLIETLGLETARTLIEVSPRSDSLIQVYGYSSAPSLQRGARNQIILFVNGRYIQDNSLTHAVVDAYHTLMPDDRYPVAVLLITLPPEDVDVNVHPTKAEVRFRNPDAVYSAVRSSIRRALVDYTRRTPSIPALSDNAASVEEDESEEFAPSTVNGTSDNYRPISHAPTFDLHTPDPGYRTQQMPSPMTAEARPIPRTVGTYTAPLPTRSNAPTLPPLRVVGQIASTYIVAEGPAGMYLIDQHAAHERILYEQFMAQVGTGKPIVQRTLDALTVEVTSEAVALVYENGEALAALGLELEPFGERMFQVRAVPALLADTNPEEAVKRILDDLANGDEPGEGGVEARLILHVCKGAAVKAGQVLSYPEMQGLIQQLSHCKSPRSCPHGRPTLVHLSREQLAKEFGRT